MYDKVVVISVDENPWYSEHLRDCGMTAGDEALLGLSVSSYYVSGVWNELLQYIN